MRLWHKDLISVLPRQQLLSQWRECCCIIRNIAENGTPNHLLVNKIMNYPLSHFYKYTMLVIAEMQNRGYKINKNSMDKFKHNFMVAIKYGKFYEIFDSIDVIKNDANNMRILILFDDWHNKRYLTQCFYNLQEKADCSGVTNIEYAKLYLHYGLLVGDEK